MSVEEDHSQLHSNSNGKTNIWMGNAIFVIVAHIIAAYALIFTSPSTKTQILSIVVWQGASLGITMGYHRLWSHRAFSAKFGLRLILAVLGTMAFQGSIKWWVQRHRLHHRFTDTVDDPYNAKRGFWFSHIGWILSRPHYRKLPLIDLSDLMADPVVVFQHRFYIPLALLSGIVLPIAICSVWNDSLNGFFWCGYVSRVFIWHCTFSINSFAHWIGSQDFSTEMTARGNWLLALFTVGEGHHNFHHEFPRDYRNGVNWFDYDPTKWVIYISSLLSQAYSLRVTPKADIRKAFIATAKSNLAIESLDYDWGLSDDELPIMTLSEIESKVSLGESLIVLDGYVLDVSDFFLVHPGGAKLLKINIGKDATDSFNGGLNNHTFSAKMKAKTLRIARISASNY